MLEIAARLRAEGTDWANGALKLMQSVSPSACFWSLEALRRGAKLDLAGCLLMELRMTRTIAMHPDFWEGVRSVLVDKDRNPNWSPKKFEDVDTAAIARIFA